MVRNVATRSQRRMEKKQAVVLLVLILAASLVAFVLGVMVGRSGSKTAVAAAPSVPVRVAVGQPLPEPSEGGKKGANLTFYDSLPKGEKPPMGSGINLPPKKDAPAASSAPAPPPAQTAVASPEKTAEPSSSPSAVSKGAEKAPKTAKAQAPAVPSAKVSAPAASGGSYVVQAAAFRKSEDAKALQTRLSKKGLAAYTQEATVEGKGTWYRVFVGPFATSDAAEAAVARLKSEDKLTAMVRKR